jgi:hypothetical protein
MGELIGGLRTAVVEATDAVVAREKDGSFLERTLRDALADRLPAARTEHRVSLSDWAGRLGGVDIVYQPASTRLPVGVETKVWDVADSLYDVFKLAAGTQEQSLAAGFVVVAGRARDWLAPSVVGSMSVAKSKAPIEWDTEDLLRNDIGTWSRIWGRASVLPRALPSRFQVLSTAPVAMPRVPGHEIRLIGVQALGGP